MKYLDVVRGLKLIENMYREADLDCDGADVRLVKFQDGANGPIRDRLEMTRGIAGAEICISFTPTEKPEIEDPAKDDTDGEKPYFTTEQVRNMSLEEVRKNYSAIMVSMKKWR